MAITLSLAMIVRDAQPSVGVALECVADICDELIVVDTGSTDDTRECAKNMGAVVHEFNWIDDFAAARNRSFELCTSDWILWLDHDDYLSPCSTNNLREFKNECLSEDIDAIFLPYQVAFGPTHKPAFSFYRERLIRRKDTLRWQYPVHECVYIPQERARFRHDICVEHRPGSSISASKHPERNLQILEKAFASGDRCARNLFYYANELSDLSRFADAIAAYSNYLAGPGRMWERYYALTRLGRCHSVLDETKAAWECAIAAIDLDPSRAEAFNDAGIILYRQKRFAEAIPFFHAAAKLDKPAAGSFVEDCQYEWLPPDYLSSCYTNLRQFCRAQHYTEIAIDQQHPERDRLLANLEFLRQMSRAGLVDEKTEISQCIPKILPLH